MSKFKKSDSVVKGTQSAAGITAQTGEVIKKAVEFAVDMWVKLTDKKSNAMSLRDFLCLDFMHRKSLFQYALSEY